MDFSLTLTALCFQILRAPGDNRGPKVRVYLTRLFHRLNEDTIASYCLTFELAARMSGETDHVSVGCRRKRGEKGEVVETIEDVIVRRLTSDRIEELKKLISETQEAHRFADASFSRTELLRVQRRPGCLLTLATLSPQKAEERS